MGTWYWIGVSAGVGAAVGVFASSSIGFGRRFVAGSLGSLWIGGMSGTLVDILAPGGWSDVVVGGVGGLLGFLGVAPIVAGALRRGGTRGGIAVLVTGAAVVVAGIAFIPAAGYLEALALPALAARLRRTQPERYAGLRTLARD